MDDAALDTCLDRIRRAYGQAYYDLDILLKGMGLTDDQVLLVMNAAQPMLQATADLTVISMLWERQSLLQSDGEWIPFLEREAQETCRRYVHDDK